MRNTLQAPHSRDSITFYGSRLQLRSEKQRYFHIRLVLKAALYHDQILRELTSSRMAAAEALDGVVEQ